MARINPAQAVNRSSGGVGRKARLAWACLLAGVMLLVPFARVFAACEEYIGQQFRENKHLASAQAPFTIAQAGSDVYLRWLGHSSFLIISQKGIKGLTDPNSAYPLDDEVAVVTMSNNHITHSDTSALKGKPVILSGLDARGNPVRVNRFFNDLQVQNLVTTPGPVGINTIFMYKTGGICIAHLGNLITQLTPSQVRTLQDVDVLLVPIHGFGSASRWDEILNVISQLKPRLAIPMHYDHPGRAQAFVEFVGDRLPVKKARTTSILLHRGSLPRPSLLLILGAPDGT